jgi:hypothetical protein
MDTNNIVVEIDAEISRLQQVRGPLGITERENTVELGIISWSWQDGLQASHDLEDFIAVIEGRDTLLQEIAESPQELRRCLAEAAKTILAESRFLDVLPGFVLDNERVPLIQERLAELVRQG